MVHHVNFTPGPSQLYFTVADHARNAFKTGIPSMSHRAKDFEAIVSETTAGLKELLGVPNDFSVFFTSSATEIWERSIQNLVAERSHHFVNGAFSKRYFEIAQLLNRKPEKTVGAEGDGFKSLQNLDTELIALTHNETSTGVSLPLDFIHGFKTLNPEALIAVDAVSSLPFPKFDYSKIDSVFFSVQKGFGLPAGLGVWIVNDRCIQKAEVLLRQNISIGSYHSIPSLKQLADKNQTPETPNVLGIYLLNQVVQDFLRRGIETLRRETEYKAATLYHVLNQHPFIKPFVKEKEFQSKTVIVADCQHETERLTKFLLQRGLSPGDGYGANKKTQLRFANFPAHSKEQFEQLADAIAAFE